HQLNQLVLAQPLQISAIHAHMDSEFALPGKGAPEIRSLAPIGTPKMGVGKYSAAMTITLSRSRRSEASTRRDLLPALQRARRRKMSVLLPVYTAPTVPRDKLGLIRLSFSLFR